MFTGIVEEVGVIGSLVRAGAGYRLWVRGRRVLEDLKLGDSVAVNGACLTAAELGESAFAVDLSPETLRRTNLGELKPGDRVNLERALRPLDRMGGHFVQGHVDGVGTIAERRLEGDAVNVRFTCPADLSRYIVEKGFVAVDGVSLTVTARGEGWFAVSLVPFTQQAVTLTDKRVGAKVNLEVDIIGKYVESLIAVRREGTGITHRFLAEHGFA